MKNSKYGREVELAVKAVREASRLCKGVQAEVSAGVLEKLDRSPVTVADYGSQALVCRALREAFPEDAIIAEEDTSLLLEPKSEGLLERITGHVSDIRPEADRQRVIEWIENGRANAYTDRFWTLDPIDGTKGFLRGEQYAIALALLVDGEVQVAALACPNLPGAGEENGGTVFAAVRGHGAVAYPIDADSNASRLQTSRTDDPSRARFCESVESGHSSHNDAARVADSLGIVNEPIRMDSQAKYAVVARGEADLYLRLPTRQGYVEKIWDHAAGVLVVTEAGGQVTDIYGRPLEFHHGRGLENNRGVVVSNGLLHDRVLQAISGVGVTAR